MQLSMNKATSLLAISLLSGCGGGGGGETTTPTPSDAQVQIRVVDGPIHNATVCFDSDGNNTCDSSEYSVVTDENGYAFIPSSVYESHKASSLLAIMAQGLSEDTIRGMVTSTFPLTAEAGSKVITPFTTLVHQQVVNNGISIEEAQQNLLEKLALLGENITTDNLESDWISSNDDVSIKLSYIAEMLTDQMIDKSEAQAQYLNLVEMLSQSLATVPSESLANIRPKITYESGTYSISDNYRPHATSAISDQTLEVGVPIEEINLNDYFSDKDGDVLTYEALKFIDGLPISDDGILSGTPKKAGKHQVQVVAKDGYSQSLPIEFNITITAKEPIPEPEPKPVSKLVGFEEAITINNFRGTNTIVNRSNGQAFFATTDKDNDYIYLTTYDGSLIEKTYAFTSVDWNLGSCSDGGWLSFTPSIIKDNNGKVYSKYSRDYLSINLTNNNNAYYFSTGVDCGPEKGANKDWKFTFNLAGEPELSEANLTNVIEACKTGTNCFSGNFDLLHTRNEGDDLSLTSYDMKEIPGYNIFTRSSGYWDDDLVIYRDDREPHTYSLQGLGADQTYDFEYETIKTFYHAETNKFVVANLFDYSVTNYADAYYVFTVINLDDFTQRTFNYPLSIARPSIAAIDKPIIGMQNIEGFYLILYSEETVFLNLKTMTMERQDHLVYPTGRYPEIVTGPLIFNGSQYLIDEVFEGTRGHRLIKMKFN